MKKRQAGGVFGEALQCFFSKLTKRGVLKSSAILSAGAAEELGFWVALDFAVVTSRFRNQNNKVLPLEKAHQINAVKCARGSMVRSIYPDKYFAIEI